MRDILTVLNDTAIEIFEGKKKALEEGDEAVTKQIGQGNDIMSILSTYDLPLWYKWSWPIAYAVRANLSASEEDRLSKEELLGQMS